MPYQILTFVHAAIYHIKPFKRIVALLFLLTQSAVLSADSIEPSRDGIIMQRPKMSGIVSSVDADGIMHLTQVTPIENKSTGMIVNDDGTVEFDDELIAEHENRIVTVKQWGTVIEPSLLALLVVDRPLSCVIIYKTDKYMVGDCRIRIDFGKPSNFKMPDDEPFSNPPIRRIVKALKLGSLNCSEEDLAHVVTDAKKLNAYTCD